MFQRTRICSGLLLAFGGAAAHAQDAAGDAQGLQRVEITGSSIRRINQEGALPVTTLTQADIQKSGATSVTDLIQMLPSMQGFVPASSSVNGAGGGVTTAAIHGLPSKYTLVLLDGQRIAPLALGAVQGGGYGVNLESIPIAAIERVEVLTDGASAIYGSDAIGGVVNFITKKNKKDGEVFATLNRPQHPGGGSWNVAVTKGFGDYATDGNNILVSFSHDHQAPLAASQRSFSRNGAAFPFFYKGTNYIFYAPTSNTEPANITFNAYPTGTSTASSSSYNLNPYYTANGNCGNPLAKPLTDPAVLGGVGVSCRFNYAATVQDLPESDRTSGMIRGTFKLDKNTQFWAEANASEFKLKAAYAPSAQPLPVSSTQLPALYNKYVVPYLQANNLTIDGDAKAGYRSVSLGDRTDVYTTNALHGAFGFDGFANGWDYRASVSISHAEVDDTAAGGYSDFNLLNDAVANGTYDPILGTGAQSLSSAIIHNQLSHTSSNLNALHLSAQHDLFELPGGTSIIAIGADYTQTHFAEGYDPLILSQSGFSTQPASSDYAVGGVYGQVPFDASRNNWGAYGELNLPITKEFEADLSGRYDKNDKVHSNYVFSNAIDPVTGLQNQTSGAFLGNTSSATTGKLTLKYTPTRSMLFRGSIGTGFKAPNLSDIAGALVYGGATAGSYACPFPGSVGCFPGSAQYDLLSGSNGLSGSAGLKPERSTQWTLGFRVEPLDGLTGGLDVWNVKLKDQIQSSGIAEQVGFANPAKYANLFVNPYQDPAGFTTIAFEQLPFNGGSATYRGIDWDILYKTNTSVGPLSVAWTGTQMLTQKYNDFPGALYHTDLGVYGPDQQVVFRTISNVIASLQTGAFTNTLSFHFKSGYHDASYDVNTDVYLAGANGSLGNSVAFGGIRVRTYKTFDWQTQYDVSKAWQVTVGIKNLFDRDPPMSLQTGGGGNQVGYDGRYTDPIGRQIYATGRYRF